MNLSDLRQFLDAPASFGDGSPKDAAVWRSGLHDFAAPALAEDDKPAFRSSQVEAWGGLADSPAALVLGPPGTGKTYIASWMTLGYMLASRAAGAPLRVLVTAFTRGAIANVLEGIARKAQTYFPEDAPYVGFLGRPPETGLDSSVSLVTQTQLVEKIGNGHAVVGCTIWELHKLLANQRLGPPEEAAEFFELVCIDEASQMKVTDGLMALRALSPTGRMLVAGDDKQLPPIGVVKEVTIGDLRLGSSFYTYLSSGKVPEFALTETFRLNRPLVQFPSKRFYDGNYEAAGEAAERKLCVAADWRDGLEPWLEAALDPEFPICVVVYDGPPAGTQNPHEAFLTKSLIRALWGRLRDDKGDPYASEEFWNEGLAVVSPHRAQNASIRQSLKGWPFGEHAVVETVERIQGRERDAIVAGYCVSDPEFAQVEAPFLFSAERFNVTITRARTKLVLLVSRALLTVVPSDEEVFDAAQSLRDFVFGCKEVVTTKIPGEGGVALNVTLRVAGFDASAIPEVDFDREPDPEPLPDFTPALDELLRAVHKVADESPYGNARARDLRRELARHEIPFSEFRSLYRLGKVKLQVNAKLGDEWLLYPCDTPAPHSLDETTVLRWMESSIEARAGRWPARYEGYGSRNGYRPGVRDAYVWMSDDGTDLLEPYLRQLQQEDYLRIGVDKFGHRTIELVKEPPVGVPLPEPDLALKPTDFLVLNALEDVEESRINFGIFEGWLDVNTLAERAGMKRPVVADAIPRLREHGFIMRGENGVRFRSRMAELARELRYVKQRFTEADAGRRPYLVRSLKVRIKARRKPVRDRSLQRSFEVLRESLPRVDDLGRVLDALSMTLRASWGIADGQPIMVSGFQARSFEALTKAWLDAGSTGSYVITADTGAGKTEAACFPILVGATVDMLAGVAGVRAVLVYPRIRLGANQAQRLTGYLAGIATELGRAPSIGLQNGSVPRSWEAERKYQNRLGEVEREKQTWKPLDAARWAFPYFRCPSAACNSELELVEGGGAAGADRLHCATSKGCGWSFDHWVGTKQGLIETPPSLFLPVTESLHQWMQDKRYMPLFGDDTRFAAPRLVLADEIHLYDLVHGAHVGYMLQRLLARCASNSSGHDALAVGMSATLGAPSSVWGGLVGRNSDSVTHITPYDDERELNPRGREYFYFMQPEVESRGKNIAGASTTIQALMCLAHGMRRRTGDEGGYRGIAFLDSIDKLRRVHSAYTDAESHQRLARLRVSAFGTDAQTGHPRNTCCEHPEACDRFQDGECWYFAASDSRQWTVGGQYQPGRPLKVVTQPIFSGSGGRADDLVQSSDVVFSTSSLEVGFDDPDMTLVYQHYAPMNLASFVQRKGRGGRGSDDRPVTGTTLSLYSARDSWYFTQPDLLLDAASYHVPINMENFFVLRGQVLACLLDEASRYHARADWTPVPTLPTALLEKADLAVRDLFGGDVYTRLEVRSLEELWEAAVAGIGANRLTPPPPKYQDRPFAWWRETIDWIPSRLFDARTIPKLVIDLGDKKPRDEEVGLAFSQCAPGQISRRFHPFDGYWNPPAGPRAPMFKQAQFAAFDLVPDGGVTSLRDALPDEVWHAVGERMHPRCARPTRVQVVKAGSFNGADWTASWRYDDVDTLAPVPADGKSEAGLQIQHQTTGRLRKVVLIALDPSEGETVTLAGLTALSETGMRVFSANLNRPRRTGLRATVAFWGVDIEYVTTRGHERETVSTQQIFTDPDAPDDDMPRLHGYGMETEGIAIHLSSNAIDGFVQKFTAGQTPSQAGWFRNQHLRFRLGSELSRVGLGQYQAAKLAELFATAMVVDSHARALRRLLKRWDGKKVLALLQAVRAEFLGCHPILTDSCVDALEESLAAPGVQRGLRAAFAAVDDPGLLAQFLRSNVTHGLLQRLKTAFVVHGQGDERQVLGHVKLPVQYGARAEDVLTVCEVGQGGDGTTRTFVDKAPDVFASWMAEGIINCPNAAADRLVASAYELASSDDEWRRLDPTDYEGLRMRLRDAFGESAALDQLQGVVGLLFGAVEFGGQRFETFTLYAEAALVRKALHDFLKREPTMWELASAVVGRARDGEGALVPNWTRLRSCYAAIPDAVLTDGLSVDDRVSDQVVRIAAKLCVDGCPACLHTGSDIVGDGQVAALTSRQLLEAFSAFLHGTPGSGMGRTTGVDPEAC